MLEEIIIILMLSTALAMDASAVSLSLGMSGLARNFTSRYKIAFTFGAFQSGLFALGYISLSFFGDKFSAYNSYISAVILGFLGVKMLKEVFSEEANSCPHNVCLGLGCSKTKCDRTGQYRLLTNKLLLIFGIATSIDAFAVGASYRLGTMQELFYGTTATIGVITFILSFFGATIGFKLKHKIGKFANLTGGIILLLLAIKSIL